MYQAHATPFMAWVNAANAAMLADAFRIAGKADLMKRYQDAAIEAWTIANEKELDVSYTIGNGASRGRDFKMLAAACLYNLTGRATTTKTSFRTGKHRYRPYIGDRPEGQVQPVLGNGDVSFVCQESLATHPPSHSARQHESLDSARGDAEERAAFHRASFSPQQ
jgi:hypothetical protein